MCRTPWEPSASPLGAKPSQGTVGRRPGDPEVPSTALSSLSRGHGGAALSQPASPGLPGRGWWPEHLGHGSPQLPTWLAGDPEAGALPALCRMEGARPQAPRLLPTSPTSSLTIHFLPILPPVIWPSLRSSKFPRNHSPQSLCTCCYLFLKCSSFPML